MSPCMQFRATAKLDALYRTNQAAAVSRIFAVWRLAVEGRQALERTGASIAAKHQRLTFRSAFEAWNIEAVISKQEREDEQV